MTVQQALSLTAVEIAREIKRVTYKPGWVFEVGHHPIEGPTLSISFAAPNSYRQGEQQVQRVNTPIPPLFGSEHLCAWLMWRISIIEMHELGRLCGTDANRLRSKRMLCHCATSECTRYQCAGVVRWLGSAACSSTMRWMVGRAANDARAQAVSACPQPSGVHAGVGGDLVPHSAPDSRTGQG
jgi:hypothetical protein